jgi:hypothetical protein
MVDYLMKHGVLPAIAHNGSEQLSKNRLGRVSRQA